MGLEKEVSGIVDLKNRASSTEEEVSQKLGDLRNKILEGRTTGDPVKDFVIAVHGSIEEEDVLPYRQLQEMLKDREGEQVLVINEEIYVSGKTGCFGGTRRSYVQSSLRLGILTSKPRFEIGDGEGLGDFLKSTDSELSGPRIVLPTEKYAAKIHEKFSTPEWELKEGEIQIRHLEFANFDPSGEKAESSGFFGISSHNHPSSRRLLVRIGSEQVEEYFRLDRSTFKDDISDSEIGYVEALDLLGIGDQAPNDFRKGYNEKIHGSKIEILDNLRELARRRIKLKDKIKKIYDKIGTQEPNERSDGMVYYTDFTADTAKSRSGSEKRDLGEVKKDIKSRLEVAVSLGMHSKPWILKGERPGETLDVPFYITKMCVEYRVNV